MEVPTTTDALLSGQLILEQPAPGHGYRFNADSVLLAQFAARAVPSAETLVDLGAGVGTVSLGYDCIAHAGRVVLVEQSPWMCAIASRNMRRVRGTPCDATISCNVEALRNAAPGLKADLVVSNPPYTRPGMGRRHSSGGRDAARHGEVMPFLRAGAELLCSAEATLALCYPAHDLVMLLLLAREVGLHATTVQLVHATSEKAARIALVALHSAAQPTAFAPPIIEDEGGRNP